MNAFWEGKQQRAASFPQRLKLLDGGNDSLTGSYFNDGSAGVRSGGAQPLAGGGRGQKLKADYSSAGFR